MSRRIFEHVPKPDIPALEQINGTPIGRMYKTPEGKMYPSATTVFGHFKKKEILAWQQHVGLAEANRIRDEAAARGTLLHEVCEKYLLNDSAIGRVTKDMTVLDMFNVIRPKLDRHVGRVHAVETRLYSDMLGVAGTTDLVAEWDGRLSIIDFKSARRAKKEEKIGNYFEQATCYACMWEERTGRPVTQLVILIAPKGAAAQVFIKKRDDYLHEMIKKVQVFQRQHKLEIPSEAVIANRMSVSV